MPNTVKETTARRGPAAAPAPQRETVCPPPPPPSAPPDRRLRLPPGGVRASALAWQLGAACTGILLGAGRIYGGAAPFGLALVIGCAPGYLLSAALGAIAGVLAFQPLAQALP